MVGPGKGVSLLSLFLCAGAISPGSALAQDAPTPEVESLIAASGAVDSGLALARRQIAETDLLAAAATLERVLLAQPEAVPARLLYAGLLCRLDDAAGARVELALLEGQAIDDAAWGEVTSACGPLPRPAQPVGGAQ